MLLEARGLSYASPDGRQLADGLDFSLLEGEVLLVSGANGSGKTSLLRLLTGQRGPTLLSGTLRRRVPLAEIAILPQVHRSVSSAPLTLGDAHELLSHPRRPTASPLVSPELLARAWNTASGGERQRVLLAAALAREPRLLVLDEPTNHLDLLSRKLIVAALDAFLREKPGRGAVVVSHDEGFDALTQITVKRVSLGSGAPA